MSQEPINAEAPLEEQLVAYLDGEMDSESCRRIEELLAVDPEVRRKLHWLEQTWEMLDELDATPVDENFTRTTLEMVAIAAQEDARKVLEEAPRRRRRFWMLAGCGLFVAGLAGFMTVSLIAASQNKKLIRDLPILENLEEYRQIKDIKFLKMLKDEDLFPKGEYNASSRPAILGSDDDNLQYIKSLGAKQKNDLLRKHESFSGMGPAEQDLMRQLHKQIEEDKDDDLRGVMERYYEWYSKTLLPYSQYTLTQLPAEKRIEWIKKRRQEEQANIGSRPPTPTDADAIWIWMENYADKHEKQFDDRLPRQLRQKFPEMSAAARRHTIMWIIWQRPQSGIKPSDDDLEDLRSRLSAGTQKLLESKSKSEQIRIIQNWAHNLLRQKRGLGLGELVDDKLLAEFFEKELTDEQRDQLMTLSGEDMQRDLLWLYIRAKAPEMFPPRQGGGPPGPPQDRQGPRPDMDARPPR
jgi:hypothetical protein